MRAHWSAADTAFMHQALDLAARGLGRTSPNPVVGALIVRDGRVVGRGYHQEAGGPHAEIHAIKEAGPSARGATLYVTLEPCNHYGRTPPCVRRCIESGIARVVVASQDPDPRVSGKGIQALRSAGVHVEEGLLVQDAARLNEAYLTAVTLGRPFVHYKYAMSLDGKVAAHTGKARWVTGETARAEVQELRARHDAVMVGIGTALADDPLLTARTDPPPARQPLRVVVDSRARLSPDARCVSTAPQQLLVAVAKGAPHARVEALTQLGVRTWQGTDSSGRVDLSGLLHALYRMDIRSVLLEGGPTLAAALTDAGLIDRVTAYVAPLLIGGERAPSPLAGRGAPDPEAGSRLVDLDVRAVGEDWVITGRTDRGEFGAHV